jgi:hypothetical protein
MKSEKASFMLIALIVVLSLLLTQCGATPETIVQTVEVPVEKEVEVTVVETVEVETEVIKEVEVTVVETVEVETEVIKEVEVPVEAMRDLEGTLVVAVEGAVPVPGAPLTKKQEAWQKLLRVYKQLQPNVEVIVEDLPEGSTGEVYCDARIGSNTMPDISMIGNCDYFRPSPEEIEAGTAIATDFMPYSEETNPYTGRPWKNDWINDAIRLTRCQEGGAIDTWTCMTEWLELKVIFVNWDILNEYGYTEMPGSLTELYELCDEINADGTYACFDNSTNRMRNFNTYMTYLVAMDVYEEMGGSLDNLDVSLSHTLLQRANYLCDKTWWITEQPSLQEVFVQTKRWVDANGGGELFFDPTREPGRLWLTNRAAFMVDSTEFMPAIEQARADGTFLVDNWSVAWYPEFTEDELVNKDLDVYFDGTFWVEYGGQGDNFAPTPNVRASGEDPNVDLLVRDFFQFLSSPLGAQRIVDQGLVPVSPVALQAAPEFWIDALDEMVPIATGVYQGVTQPIVNMNRHLRDDPELWLEAYFRGDAEFEEAALKADENTTMENVRRLQDDLAQFGLEELPDVCKPYAGQ